MNLMKIVGTSPQNNDGRKEQMLVTRSGDQNDICGLCDEFDLDQAAPERTALGQGRCLARDEASRLHPHVDWNGRTCVLFRLDRPNLQQRRQFVEVQRRANR
jgi:hypothetical protein